MGIINSSLLVPFPKDYRVERCMRLFRVPEHKLEELWRLFIHHDRDKKGFIYMQEFLDYIVKSPKTPLTTALPGLIETKHEGCMDFGEFVEIICTICNFEKPELIRFAFYILDPFRTGRIERNELKHFIESIWNHDAPITLQEALTYLDDRDEQQSEVYTIQQINQIVGKYPSIFYPVYKLQIHMIENTLGTYWWESHKANVREEKEEEKRRELEELEKRRRNDDIDDEAVTLRVVKTRLGIRYYLMPWLIAVEKKKMARIAAIENELNSQLRKG